ncbi:MAG: type II secretion system protein [Pirellulales bacterium]
MSLVARFGSRRQEGRRGLTLMELVVVMVILAALAGILLPLLPGMVKRAHTSTSATNVSEVAKAIQTHQAVYLSLPNNLDSLVNATGTLVAYLPGNTGGDLTTLTLTDDTADALNDVGITTMAQMIAAPSSNIGDFGPTFYPYGTDKTVLPTATALADGVAVASLLPAAANRLYAAPLGASYTVFGLGSRTSMQGKSLQEAPVHFADAENEAPHVAYARYGAVFQVTDSTGNPLESAKLIGICAFHGDGVVSLNDHLGEYWSANKN